MLHSTSLSTLAPPLLHSLPFQINDPKEGLFHHSNYALGKDEVWCDVAPMDAFHILLGLQWLYERYVTHKALDRPGTRQSEGTVPAVIVEEIQLRWK